MPVPDMTDNETAAPSTLQQLAMNYAGDAGEASTETPAPRLRRPRQPRKRQRDDAAPYPGAMADATAAIPDPEARPDPSPRGPPPAMLRPPILSLDVAYVVLDLETSGFSAAAGNYPTQFAWGAYGADHRELFMVSTFVTGATVLDAWVLENCPHVSLDRLVHEGQPLETVVNDLCTVLRRQPRLPTIVCHNVAFDITRVLMANEDVPPAAKLVLQSCPKTCTMLAGTDVARIPKTGRAAAYGGWKWPTLAELCRTFDIDTAGLTAHDATDDVRMTARCYTMLPSVPA
jgi:DNA polymerase III epsilon subunit-like protein